MAVAAQSQILAGGKETTEYIHKFISNRQVQTNPGQGLDWTVCEYFLRYFLGCRVRVLFVGGSGS